MSNQYQLTIKDGQVQSEEGHVYVAGPFQIKSGDVTVDCVYRQTNDHRVIYAIIINNEVIDELEHPGYMPEGTTPDAIPADRQFIFSALLHLGIAKGKEWVEFFQSETSPKLSYEISQNAFYELSA
ncbi:hypothetical protein HOH87_01220 [bacterium]|nr:hypothetical protein [bacterium]